MSRNYNCSVVQCSLIYYWGHVYYDTYYVVGHFHYVLSMGAIYALLGGQYYWVGKITGVQYNEKQGLIHQFVFTIAVNIVFLPMHFIGIAGMPRRIPDYADGYLNWNLIMTLGTFLTIISVVIVLRNLNRAMAISRIVLCF